MGLTILQSAKSYQMERSHYICNATCALSTLTTWLSR
jgi:hypothetical protein